MRRTSMTRAVILGLLALLALPATGLADSFDGFRRRIHWPLRVHPSHAFDGATLR